MNDTSRRWWHYGHQKKTYNNVWDYFAVGVVRFEFLHSTENVSMMQRIRDAWLSDAGYTHVTKCNIIVADVSHPLHMSNVNLQITLEQTVLYNLDPQQVAHVNATNFGIKSMFAFINTYNNITKQRQTGFQIIVPLLKHHVSTAQQQHRYYDTSILSSLVNKRLFALLTLDSSILPVNELRTWYNSNGFSLNNSAVKSFYQLKTYRTKAAMPPRQYILSQIFQQQQNTNTRVFWNCALLFNQADNVSNVGFVATDNTQMTYNNIISTNTGTGLQQYVIRYCYNLL